MVPAGDTLRSQPRTSEFRRTERAQYIHRFVEAHVSFVGSMSSPQKYLSGLKEQMPVSPVIAVSDKASCAPQKCNIETNWSYAKNFLSYQLCGADKLSRIC